MYEKFLYINQSSKIQVNFENENINPKISFIVFQVHSHIYNVTVYNNTKNYMSTQTGTNVGFYSSVTLKIDTFFIENPNTIGFELYVAVFGYYWPDPIPGGCNMEFPQPIAPYIRVITNDNYILADAALPQAVNDMKCTELSLNVKFYMMYLPERDFSQATYFDSLKNMLTLDKIVKKGVEIPETNIRKELRRMTSAYRGTGVIYVAVAYTYPEKLYSVYAPGYSYACSPLVDGCELLDDLLSRFICILLLFGGLFICFLGHRFFKTEMFLIGLLSGVVITYILISLIAELDNSALVLASLLSGTFFGAVWCLFWWFYGIPVVSVLLPAMNVGFLAAAIFYYRLPGGILMLQDEIAFWTLFVFLMLIISVLFVPVTFICNIMACAVLGAYAVVYPMDFYFGSNLRYIIINVVRRAVVPGFEKAVLSPPFEWKDGAVTVMWIVLAMSGFLFQQYHNRGRPPFPPPPRSISPRMPDLVDHREQTEERRHWRYLRIVARPRTNPQPTETSPLLL
ncbi:transmembrane 7 superfamily member 3-like isoform X2 [Plodia interpunctella]|nr:transmembrane 7 superfamily member 3-like isoform X2 [Plodia interpunctella]